MDDHGPSRRALAETVLAAGGQIVAESPVARDVVTLIERHRPDVVVCAVGLPDADGVEVARRIAAEAACPVVLLSSRTEPAISIRAGEAGVLGFLAKPLRPAEVAPALDVAVCRHRELTGLRLENDALRRTIETRKVIERAKGVLMARAGLSEPEAFRRIRKAAMDARRPMADIARALLLADEIHAPLPH